MKFRINKLDPENPIESIIENITKLAIKNKDVAFELGNAKTLIIEGHKKATITEKNHFITPPGNNERES